MEDLEKINKTETKSCWNLIACQQKIAYDSYAQNKCVASQTCKAFAILSFFLMQIRSKYFQRVKENLFVKNKRDNFLSKDGLT